MDNNIELLQMSAKLPGYLFVLSKIADIDETIYLCCRADQKGFYKSMLALIGLNVQPVTLASDRNFILRFALIVCDAIEDLECIREIDIEDITLVILLPEQSFYGRDHLVEITRQYISSRHKWVMISEKVSPVQKKFFVLVTPNKSGINNPSGKILTQDNQEIDDRPLQFGKNQSILGSS